VSDVPIALMYSAGLDSNLVAKSVSKFTKVNAFSLGFDSFKKSKNDEIPYARMIAADEGYKFNFRYFSDNELLSYLDQYFNDLDTLSIDGFNTWLVSKYIAEAGYKVAMSGAGGDELFKGYANFAYLKWMKRCIDLVPKFPRYLISKLIPKKQLRNRKIRHALNANSLLDLYFIKRSLFDLHLLSDYFDKENLDIIYPKFLKHKTESIELFDVRDDINVSSLEYHFYCRNQLIKDADWASMSHSLELRVPLVDKEFYKEAIMFRNQTNLKDKYEYYSLYDPSLNINLFNRSKTGFSMPLLSLIGQSNDYVTNYKALLNRAFYQVTGEEI
jgi:asparagine synthase (glutamine-hydrolysing)